MGDLFALQDEFTTSLSAALAPEIFRAEASAPARASSNDLTAWDRFLRGLSHYYLQTKADFETAIALFKEAIALDPTLVDRPRLSRHHQAQSIQFGWIKGTRELWTKRWSSRRAVSGSIPARPLPFRFRLYARA